MNSSIPRENLSDAHLRIRSQFLVKKINGITEKFLSRFLA